VKLMMTMFQNVSDHFLSILFMGFSSVTWVMSCSYDFQKCRGKIISVVRVLINK
jgi:hypothetical protein